MNLISEHSVFRFLPIKMQHHQLLIFDAIKMTFDMIEYNYNSLENILVNFSHENTTKNNRSEAFNYAWGIIDHTSRLIKLFKKLPSASNHESLKDIIHINDFRNTIQHLHERIDESMLKIKSPFYGILIWYHKNISTGKVTPISLISGINFGSEISFTIPDLSLCNNEINDIIIQTVNKKERIVTSISSLMLELKNLCEKNELVLNNFFKEQGWELCDWSMQQDIIIRFNSGEEK